MTSQMNRHKSSHTAEPQQLSNKSLINNSSSRGSPNHCYLFTRRTGGFWV